MDEDHDDELRFVCKLCDKRFPSGKSLGGHMRSHVLAAATATTTTTTTTATATNSDELYENFEPMKDNGNSNIYGLRENPKKSWRASSSSTIALPNEKICKQCGKGFKSLKALCGHMAFHSGKDKGMKDYDYSWTSGSDSDHTDENELQDPVFVTRSEAKRCKKVVTKPFSLCLTNTNSSNSNYNYGSSSVSEIDEFEQEDVAMCLMMLSKDSGNWGGVNSVVESSDNTSVELETKLSAVEMNKSRKEWNLAKNDAESFPFENSNSRLCRNGIKKVESDMKGFNYRDLSYEEKQEIRRNLFREFGYDNSLKKRIRDDDSYKKKNKYECLNCNKTFSTFQGLGGHRPCHKKNNNAFNAVGNSSGAAAYARIQKTKFEKNIRPKKNKGHECPICFRMFKSGQALGGHKRSHFINGAEDRIDHMEAMEQVSATYADMIDLNLPAPEED